MDLGTMDLDAYFRRIGYTGPRTPTPDVLRAICAAHPAAIPFENIDPLLGHAPRLSPPALQAKLVGQRRGGYCYEQNALLRLALLGLGMSVTSLAARVLWGSSPDAPARARSHMLLTVELPDATGHRGPWLVDAGFGGHLIGTPMPLVPGLVQRTETGTERLTQDGEWMTLETELPGGWAPLYRFTLEPLLPVDYEPLNWFTGTHPGSMFCHNLLVESLTGVGRTGLLNDRLTIRPIDGPAETRRIDTADEFAQVLDELFDIEPPIPAAELYARLPKGLDGPCLPAAPVPAARG
jgi:N-hydroxyarylamine O-acetyltransferase